MQNSEFLRSETVSPLYRKGVWGIGNTKDHKKEERSSFFVIPLGLEAEGFARSSRGYFIGAAVGKH